MERTPSQDVPYKVSGHSDVVLQNKSPPKLILPVLSIHSENHNNKSPSFHRPIPPQMERTTPQGVPCKVSGHSDVVFQNKSRPNLIYYLLSPYIQKIIKIKVLASTDQFHLRWRGHLLRVSPAKFQDILMLFYKIRAPPNLIYYLLSPYIQKNHKNKSPSFHRPIPPQMERTPSQGVPCKVPGHSDVVLENKSPPNLIYFLFCSYIQKIIKIKVLASTDQFHLIWRGHLLKMSPAKFQDILMLFYKIIAPQIKYITCCLHTFRKS